VHHIPFRYEFEPPFALPGPSLYEFAIQLADCFASVEMMLDHNNDYAEGQALLHGTDSLSGRRLRVGPESFPELDLVLAIEF
jgi:hypothetical protein